MKSIIQQTKEEMELHSKGNINTNTFEEDGVNDFEENNKGIANLDLI